MSINEQFLTGDKRPKKLAEMKNRKLHNMQYIYHYAPGSRDASVAILYVTKYIIF